MDENDELARLEELLSSDLDHVDSVVSSKTEVDIFKVSTNVLQNNDNQLESLVPIENDTDSSDDEEGKNYTEKKYSDYGSQVKELLDQKGKDEQDKRLDFETRLRKTNIDVKLAKTGSFKKKLESKSELSFNNNFCAPESKIKSSGDIYTDPVFGIRIVKPLISSSAFLDRMQGREAINMLRVKRHVENGDLSKDWVIAGVIVRKSATKQSQKGSQFIIWTLSDLKDDLKTVSMFLFRKAYSELWKTMEGTVVAVLNPNVLDKTQSNSDQACLSVESHDRVMVLGQSKDMGICKSKKKNGEPCTAFVNISQCEHCIYHVKQEYQKFSKRQDLQSATMGKGLTSLRNKVLGKNTIIYGGKAYSALPKANTSKVKELDQNRLMSLSDYYKTESQSLMINKAPYGAGSLKNNSTVLHSPTTQRVADSDRLNKLTNTSPILRSATGLSTPNSSLAEKVANSPKFGQGFGLKRSGTIDLNVSYRQKSVEAARVKAARIIQQTGGLTELNPNNIRGTEAGKKRALEKLCSFNSNENDNKKARMSDEGSLKPKSVMSERFKKILEATSSHENLIKQHEDEEQEKYFSKLSKKEEMEEKMLNTYKLPCKAVRCIKCKYTAFSAAQLCKDEKHPLKVLETVKRFFKCGNCSNRTVSLEIIPLHSCSNCKSSKWEKAPMLREKKAALNDGLSIRGEEESYVGGQISAGKNINLLVPE